MNHGKSYVPKELEGQDQFQKPREVIQERFSQPPQRFTGKIPPQALEMEQAVLGGLLLERGAMDKIEDIVKTVMFYKEGNRAIFDAITALRAANQPIDLFTVKNTLSKSGTLELAGGLPYLMELTSKVSSAANIEYHARVIAQKHLLRELIKVGDDMVQRGYDATTDAFALVDESKSKLDGIDSSTGGDNIVDGADLVDVVVYEALHPAMGQYYMLGIPELDEEYTFEGGDMVIVGARPSIGKTSFALLVARGLQRQGIPVLFFGRDMKAKQAMRRELAADQNTSAMRMRRGDLPTDVLESMSKTRSKFAGIGFDDRSPMTYRALRASLRAFRKKYGLKRGDRTVVMIDYLQMMTDEEAAKNEYAGVTATSLMLKNFFQDEDVLGIPLAQLNRGSAKTGDKPALTDLRSSGQLEQDATWVLFLHRDEYYGIEQYADGTSTKETGIVIVSKVKEGRAGNEILLDFKHGQWRSKYVTGLKPLDKPVVDRTKTVAQIH